MSKTSYDNIKRETEGRREGQYLRHLQTTRKKVDGSGERRDGKKNDTHHRKGNTDFRQSLM
jgi:hypothetical protein